MKLNWKTFKVLFAFVIVIGVIFWAVNLIRPHSYSGTNLNFGVGSGSVRVTNPSEEPVLVQLAGTGARTFRISSTIEDVSGSSTRQGSGSSSTQLFEFALPPGESEFTITGGTDVNFVANTGTTLNARVNPVSSGTRTSTLIAAAVVVLGALFYASSVTEHQWISILRRKVSPNQDAPPQDTKPTPVVTDGGQGEAARSYGDNRAHTGD